MLGLRDVPKSLGSLFVAGPVPEKFTLTRVVVLFWTSRTKTFCLWSGLLPLLSMGTRSVALLRKTTKRPLALMTGLRELLLPVTWPDVLTLRHVVVLESRSRR